VSFVDVAPVPLNQLSVKLVPPLVLRSTSSVA
jgi:hypothetical protein